MADAKVSAFPAASAALLTHELPVNEAGASKKVTLDQVLVLDGQLSSVFNASGSSQSPGASDFYLGGSRLLIPAATGRGSLKAGSMLSWKVQCTKTAAGTAAPVFTVRYGTAGTTADTAIAAATGAAQTAVVDLAMFTITAFLLTAGSGTSATARAGLDISHSAAINAGLGGPPLAGTGVNAVGAGFNSTLASAGIGLSVNAGTSANWTVTMVAASLVNLN